MSKADQLLHKVWDHMHGQNMDGSMRKWGDNDACAQNWQRLSDAIGEYFEPNLGGNKRGTRRGKASRWPIVATSARL